MRRYFYISGGAHVLLFAWVMLGNLFASAPPEMQVSDVTVLSEEDFAALTAPRTPEPAAEPPAPAVAEPAPVPEPAPTPEPEPVPEPTPEPDPVPAQEPTPEPEPQPEPVPAPPGPQPAPLPPTEAPVTSTRPRPRPADRVSDTPQPEPDPEAAPADEVQEAVDPEAESPEVAEEQQEPTAPPETSTEIVTEAEVARAPSSSLRPQARPQRAAEATPQPDPTPEPAAEPAQEPTPQTEPEPPETPEALSGADDAITAALAEALGGDAAAGPAGPQLSQAEQNGFRLAVQPCWLVDIGSEAANITVTIGFEMDRDGRVVPNSVSLLSSSGGSEGAVQTAFNKARVAVLRCQTQGRDGYDLPPEKYEQWKDVEMTFNPEEMRLR